MQSLHAMDKVETTSTLLQKITNYIQDYLERENKESSERNENDENEIHKGYVVKILRKAINMLKILFKIPAIVENEPQLLKKYLNQAEVELVLQLYKMSCSMAREEEIESTSSVYGSQILAPEAKLMQDFFSDHDSPELKQIKNALNKCKSLKQSQYPFPIGYHKIKMENISPSKAYFMQCMHFVMQSKGLIDILKDDTYYKIEEDSSEARLISTVEGLAKMVSKKLNISCKEELKYDEEMRLAYRFGQVLDDNIATLEQENAKKEKVYSSQQKKKLDIIRHINRKMEKLRKYHIIEQHKTVVESERDMMRKVKSSELCQKDYADEAENSVQMYESLLRVNLKEEKNLHSKHTKLKSQLASVIAKFDADIGEKQARLDMMEKESEKLVNEIDDINDRLDEQEDEYLKLMNEKAEEERILFEETLLNFVRNRSARIIQRTWRAYKIRKLAKKLASKKKAKARAMSGGPKPLMKKKDKKKNEKGVRRVREVREKKIKDPPPKTLEQRFGDDMFKDLADADSSAFQNKEGS